MRWFGQKMRDFPNCWQLWFTHCLEKPLNLLGPGRTPSLARDLTFPSWKFSQKASSPQTSALIWENFWDQGLAWSNGLCALTPELTGRCGETQESVLAMARNIVWIGYKQYVHAKKRCRYLFILSYERFSMRGFVIWNPPNGIIPRSRGSRWNFEEKTVYCFDNPTLRGAIYMDHLIMTCGWPEIQNLSSISKSSHLNKCCFLLDFEGSDKTTKAVMAANHHRESRSCLVRSCKTPKVMKKIPEDIQLKIPHEFRCCLRILFFSKEKPLYFLKNRNI